MSKLETGLVCLTGGNDGVQFTNMAMTEQELTSQQQQADTQDANDNVPEREGMTLTTVTTIAPMAGSGGHKWHHGGRGAGRGRGQGRSTVTCFRCGQRGHYESECDATSKEVQQYRAGQPQATKHDLDEQLLHADVL